MKLYGPVQSAKMNSGDGIKKLHQNVIMLKYPTMHILESLQHIRPCNNSTI